MLVYEYINKNSYHNTTINIVDKKTKKVYASLCDNNILFNKELRKKIIKKVTIEIEKNYFHQVNIIHTLYIKGVEKI